MLADVSSPFQRLPGKWGGWHVQDSSLSQHLYLFCILSLSPCLCSVYLSFLFSPSHLPITEPLSHNAFFLQSQQQPFTKQDTGLTRSRKWLHRLLMNEQISLTYNQVLKTWQVFSHTFLIFSYNKNATLIFRKVNEAIRKLTNTFKRI